MPLSVRIAVPCTGDCDGNANVHIGELVRGVAIALGSRPVEECTTLDADANAAVTLFKTNEDLFFLFRLGVLGVFFNLSSASLPPR